MTAYTFISQKKPQLDLDILVGHSLNFQRFYTRKVNIEIWCMNVPVVSLNDLIKMKKKSGREKDLLDVKALLEFKSQ